MLQLYAAGFMRQITNPRKPWLMEWRSTAAGQAELRARKADRVR
ncbi:hypothetical protein [Methylobacterium sp. A54F]